MPLSAPEWSEIDCRTSSPTLTGWLSDREERLPGMSVAMIARDEGRKIGACLQHLQWADEIVVVVDDRTTDDTAEIARQHGARVLTRSFTGYADQRQWADEQTAGDWILSIDCDEIVTDALALEIKSASAQSQFAAYRVPHLDYMFGKWIRHGGWFPQYHVRLYRRQVARWGRAVHERVGVDGLVGTLRSPILHFSHDRVAIWIEKNAFYTTLEAQAMVANCERVGVWRIVFDPLVMFVYKFVAQQGWRDGMHGLVLALLLASARLVRNLKAWDLQQHARGGIEDPNDPPRMMTR